MKKARIGIIGLGNQGTMYVNKIFGSNSVVNGCIGAVCDINPERFEANKEKLQGVPYFKDYKEMIDSGLIDGILICVPHYAHPEMAIYALKAGVGVLCEKPAGVYTKQVREMNAVAKESKALFTMMYNQRTDPLYSRMQKMIQNNEIGEIRRLNWICTNWFRTQYYYDTASWRATWKGEGGGALINQCAHQLDLFTWILGMMPTKVRAFCHFGKWHNIETEDDVTAYLEYPNGATGCFIASTGDAPGSNRLEVLGSKGKLVVEAGELKIYRSKEDTKNIIENSEHAFRFPAPDVEVISAEGLENTQHTGILNNFCNAIVGIEPLFIPGTEGINCVELLNAMLLSSWDDKTITLPVDDDYYLKRLNDHIAISKDKGTTDIYIDNSMSYGGNK